MMTILDKAEGRILSANKAAQALRSSPVALPLGQPQGRPPMTMSDFERVSRR